MLKKKWYFKKEDGLKNQYARLINAAIKIDSKQFLSFYVTVEGK